jgi:hypothetical protein
MKKTLLILAALAIATAAYAADAAKGIERGDKALLFSATGLSLAGFGGSYDIGMKYYVAHGLAVRPVLKFGYSRQTTKIPPDSGGPVNFRRHRTFDDVKENTVEYGFDLGVEKCVSAKGAVNINAGGSIGFSLGSTSRDLAEHWTYTNNGVLVANTGGTNTSEDERSSSTFNIAGLLGAEWFISDNISLGAEYHLGMSRSSDSKNESTQTDGTSNPGVTTIVTYDYPRNTTTTFGFQAIGLVLGIRF